MRRLLSILALMSALLAGCNGVFFVPDRVQEYSPDQLGLKSEDVYFQTRDGSRLHAWFLPAKGDAQIGRAFV